MIDSVERFSNRVANYIKFRPGYPTAVIPFLEQHAGLTASSILADIGCGTGISSRLFLENGNTVIGVEPNGAMRDAATAYLASYPRFEIRDGSSSATSLADSTVDLIVAAQSFHWFEPDAARSEFQRILRPGGHVVLIWNERQIDTTPFLVDYEQLLLKYARDYSEVRHEKIDGVRLRDFFQSDYTAATFQNLQDFDFEGLAGRMLSSSYMPDEADEVFSEMIGELRLLFAKHSENGRIKVLYDTNVYISESVEVCQ